MGKVAILVDGGFYRKRAKYLWGDLSGEDRAKELTRYCYAHLDHLNSKKNSYDLYRVFYYDSLPLKGANFYHPFKNRSVPFGDSDTFQWTNTFFETLKQKRKYALRLGELSSKFASYNLKPEVTKKLFNGQLEFKDITENDFLFTGLKQQGIDMRIGVDIASLSFKSQVDTIVLIAGDSDFVPAAKLARREGIDFILDPMLMKIKDDLFEHIDGLYSPWKKKTKNK